jgi:hypothetical protein
MDLEGLVVKYKFGAYGEAWFKRVNPNYSQHLGPARDVQPLRLPLTRSPMIGHVKYSANAGADSTIRRESR